LKELNCAKSITLQMKVETCPEIKGNKLPLIYYGNKKQQMYVLSLIGSSLKPATQPQL